MRLERNIERCLVKVLAEELEWSLTPGREGPFGLPHDKKTGPKWVWKGPVYLSTMSNGSTRGGTAIHRGGQFRLLSHPLDSALDSPYPSFIQELFLLPISNSKDLYGRSGVFVLTCVLPGTSLAS